MEGDLARARLVLVAGRGRLFVDRSDFFRNLRPAAIGKRVGTKLLGEIIDRSKAAGVKEIVAVISDKGAESSIALHESFGFKHQGHLAKVGFKFGRWLGTVLMQKSL